MCLYSNTSIPKIAKKDIIVYKQLKRYKGKYKTTFYTPYMGYKMEEGIHYFQTNKKFTIKNTLSIFGKYSIERGLHSYTNLNVAKQSLLMNEIIVEMVIPRGSEYFENKQDKEIVSDNLIWYKGAKIYEN